MKRIVVIMSTLLSLLVFIVDLSSADTLDNAPKFRLFESQQVKIDLKFVGKDKGDVGIDYKLNLEKKLSDDGMSSISLKSAGFLAVNEKFNNLNSIISELQFQKYPLFSLPSQEIQKVSLDEEMGKKPEEIIAITRQQAKAVSSPLWVGADLHLKHETTQDFKDYDIAIGAALALSTSYLHFILDYPFGLLRTKENNNPRQLLLLVGYDYVSKLDQTATSILRNGDNNSNRLNFKANWETGIFAGDRIGFSWNSYYEINSPSSVKNAELDFTSFFEAKYYHLVYASKEKQTAAGFTLKYTAGKLPPNYQQSNVLGGGLSIDF